MNLRRTVPPEQMTARARIYLTIAAAQHLLIAGGLLLFPGAWSTPSFAVLAGLAPLWVWGALMLAGGLHLTWSALTGSEGHARVALVGAAVLAALWSAGFLLAWEHGVATALGGIVFAAVAGKDLMVCGQPLRSPFEPIVREFAGE